MYTMRKKFVQMFVMCMAFLFLNGITVKAASSDNSLQSLALSEGTLSPGFQYNVVAYTASVGSETTSVDVTAKTSHELATVQSITGNTDLKEGSNTIKITVAAENGNLAIYTINLTRASAQTGDSGLIANEPSNANDTSDDTSNDNQIDTPDDAQQPDASDDIVINTGDYTVVATIPEAVIPADFTMTEVTYQGEVCDALRFDKGDMTLIYMTDESEQGALFVLNQADGSVYPFVRLTAGNNYIIIQPMVAENVPGESFTAATLTIDGRTMPSAYQNEQEGMEEFYLIYAINNEGNFGTYWYDKAGGTYQRYVEMTVADESDTVEYEFLQKEFGELGDKYTKLKSKDTKIITGLIIALAICIILSINLIISRVGKNNQEYDEEDIVPKKKRKAKESELTEEPEFFDEDVWKPKKEKKKKKKRVDIFDDAEEEVFFDEEDFEETPSGKKTPIKEENSSRIDKNSSILDGNSSRVDKNSSILDELEILDLNDL